MSTENQPPKVAVLIAAITVIGSLGVALLTNWDKVFPKQASTVQSSPPVTPPISPPIVSPDPTPTTPSPGSPKTGPSVGIPSPSASPPIIATVEQDYFKFELQGCQRSGEDVQCSLSVTNLADVDRDFALSGNYGDSNSGFSRGFDSSGAEYRAAPYAQLGQAQGGSMYGYAKATLISDNSVKGYLFFDRIPQSVNRLALLDVGYITYTPFANYLNVRFKDVDIVSR